MRDMEFSLLGPLVVRRGAAEVPIAGDRARRALALLALSAGRPVAVDRLLEEVWDSPPEGAANALQSLISRLRRALGAEAPIEREGDTYRLLVAPETVDAWRFEQALAAARAGDDAALERALAEWHGEPLLGLGDTGGIAADRLRLQALYRSALLMRAAARLEAGGDPLLTADLQALCAASPLDEEAHALLLRALVAAGREAEALTRYEELRQRLREELGADPAAPLQDLHRAILRHDPALRPPPPRREGPTNLRRPLTSFIGRDEDLRELTERLRSHRLVTIVGAGGAGKTRLSQEVAGALRGDFPDGVWLVELGSVREGSEVVPTILGTLAPHMGAVAELVQSLPGDPLPGLVATLEDRRLLLLLDNCEHVVERSAEVAEVLIGGTSGVAVLATSREPLGAPGELLWPIGALGGGGSGPSDAVRLFRDRAQAVDPAFRLDAKTEPLVERICADLDGLPLAIELAAARLRSLTLQEIADRLEDRFRLLTAGRRRLGERHQTLRAVVDWSWDLLLPVERTLLRRQAVFAAACDTEAVEQSCAGLGGVDDIPPDQVLEVLSALVDRSLVVIEDREGRTFYRLLETVRAYALDRLRTSGEEDVVREAHVRWCCALAEAAAPHLRGRDQRLWLDRLDAVRPELQSAIQWAIAAGRKELAARLGAALGWYLGLRGLRDRHREWVQAALDLPGEIPPVLLARALTEMVPLGINPAADPVRDPQRLAEARAAFGAGGEPPSEDLRLRELAARMGQLRERPEEGPRLIEDLATLRREARDPWVRAATWPAEAFALIGWVPPAERRARVEEAFACGVEACRQVGDEWALAVALTGLSVCAQARGERAVAEAYLDEAFRRSAGIGWSEDVVWILIALTVSIGVAGAEEGLTPAWGTPELDALMERGLDQAQRLGTSPSGVAAGYVFLGSLAQRRGDVDLAARCFALSLAQDVPERSDTVTALRVVATSGLAWARERQGRLAEVWPLLGEAVGVLRHYGLNRQEAQQAAREPVPEEAMGLVWLAGCCRIAARVLLREGDPAGALTLAGAAANALSRLPAEFRDRAEENWLAEGPSDQEEREARSRLDEPAAAVAFARGKSMPWRDLLTTLEGRP